jgi:hypothetical protein
MYREVSHPGSDVPSAGWIPVDQVTIPSRSRPILHDRLGYRTSGHALTASELQGNVNAFGGILWTVSQDVSAVRSELQHLNDTIRRDVQVQIDVLSQDVGRREATHLEEVKIENATILEQVQRDMILLEDKMQAQNDAFRRELDTLRDEIAQGPDDIVDLHNMEMQDLRESINQMRESQGEKDGIFVGMTGGIIATVKEVLLLLSRADDMIHDTKRAMQTHLSAVDQLLSEWNQMQSDGAEGTFDE